PAATRFPASPFAANWAISLEELPARSGPVPSPMRALFLAATLALALSGNAAGQALPYHIDPSARETVPNLAPVPSIRFLTTADFPPFNYRGGDGQLIGFNVDLARSLCDELDIACTIQ